MQVDIKDMPVRRLAAVRHIGPYNQISSAFGQLSAIAGPAGLFTPGAEMIALYHDDPQATPPAQLRSDAGVTVPNGVALPSGLVEQRVAAGKYACTLHVGPYESLPETWARMTREWLPASGQRRAAGASYELYLNNPMTTPKEKLETEVCIPVASK